MNERMRKIVVVPFLLVLFVVTAGLLVYNASQVVSANPEVGRLLKTGVRVKTATVISRKYQDVFGATGDAGPSRSLAIRKAKGSGSDLAQTIDRVFVEVGDHVEPGDQLLSFDIEALGTRYEAEQSTEAALERDLDELQKREGFRRDELRAAVRSAEANVRAARSTLARDDANLERMQRLYDQDLVSRFDFEKARSTRDTAEFNLRQAEEELLQRKNQLADVESRLESERKRLVAEAKMKESEVHAYRDDIANAVKEAPWGGLIIEVQVDEGEVVMPGEGLVKIGQIDPIHVMARVSQELVDRVFTGQQTEIVFDAIPYDTFEGDVIHVDPAIDKGSATFKTTIAIANPEHRVRPGMSGFVRFKNQRQALVIPQTAVTGSGSDTAVFVDQEGVAKLRHVQVGEVVDVGFVEILGGLKAGEEVVIYGLKDLQDGDPIHVIEES